MSGDRVCRKGDGASGYCGRTSGKKTTDWSQVNCTDCHAARRADEEAKGRA